MYVNTMNIDMNNEASKEQYQEVVKIIDWCHCLLLYRCIHARCSDVLTPIGRDAIIFSEPLIRNHSNNQQAITSQMSRGLNSSASAAYYCRFVNRSSSMPRGRHR